MKTIPLTGGCVAVVDDADFEKVRGFKWSTKKSKRGIYAFRNVCRDGRRTTLYLHQEIVSGVPRVDHKDGNGLNNCRDNLRPATRRQNSQGFRGKPKGASSKFRGVSWYKLRKEWAACIRINGITRHLGYFQLEEDAARAYDFAARQHFGEFASPNFPL